MWGVGPIGAWTLVGWNQAEVRSEFQAVEYWYFAATTDRCNIFVDTRYNLIRAQRRVRTRERAKTIELLAGPLATHPPSSPRVLLPQPTAAAPPAISNTRRFYEINWSLVSAADRPFLIANRWCRFICGDCVAMIIKEYYKAEDRSGWHTFVVRLTPADSEFYSLRIIMFPDGRDLSAN